jgi:hypothetical protein
MAHDFLWRTTRCLPERGRIGIFNRSYYEEVLIVRVHPELLQAEIAGELIDEEKILGRALSFHFGSGKAPASQRHARREIFPASFQGGAAPAVSRAH